MRKSLLRTLFAVILTFTLAVPREAHAWHAVGHMAVAYVAWQQLTPRTRARAKQLLKHNPNYGKWKALVPKGTSTADTDMYIFMMAATWPDQIKAAGSGYHLDGGDHGNLPPTDMTKAAANLGYSDKALHKYWHFADNPFGPDDMQLPPLPVPNVQTEIALFRTTINARTRSALKSYDLVWLEHIVGDIHQPLHCVTRVTQSSPKGDSGGNDVQLNGSDNLHDFWDDLPGSGGTADFKRAAAYAQSLDSAPAELAADPNERSWMEESIALAHSSVYVPPIGDGLGAYTLTPEYKAQAEDVARRQVALAGARLAKLLNDNLR